jgi:Zn-dependent peptidase ImmA (M78 family)
MIRPRESLARRAANELLDEMAIVAPPVPVDDLVQRKGLRFETNANFPQGVFGALYRSGNQFGIVISAECPNEGHRRFTVAHELGHYHIPDHVDQMFVNGVEVVPSMSGHFRSQKDPLEVEADCFASELLMPARFVKPITASLGHGIAAVQTIATRFDVSLSAAAIRFAQVAVAPTVVLLSKDGVVEWAATSPALWSHQWARQSWRGDRTPRGSGTRRLAGAHDRVVSGSVDGSTMLLCEWLDRAPGDIEAEEEALGLGAYGRVLTVISASDLGDAGEYEEKESTREEPADWRSALRGYALD